MKRGAIVLVLPWVLLGCSAPSSSDRMATSQKAAIKCAENWKKQGFNFDPKSMTSAQMFERVQDIRRAAYWAEQGYRFDPNVMTGREMDEKVKDIRRAEYWNQQGGYAFDPNTMTAEEMDKRAKELETTAYWEKEGYFYDPNSQKVFTDKSMHTELGSLASIHERGLGGLPPSPGGISFNGYSDAIPESVGWQVVETTHIDGWVKKVRRGTIFKTVSGSLYEVAQPIFVSGMELRPEVTVLTNGHTYKLLIEGLEENPICDKLGKRSIASDPDSRAITGQIVAGSDGRTFTGLSHGNIYRLDNGQVWEQTEFYIHLYISVMPNVIIWNDGVTHRMKVEGIEKAVSVRRLN